MMQLVPEAIFIASVFISMDGQRCQQVEKVDSIW